MSERHRQRQRRSAAVGRTSGRRSLVLAPAFRICCSMASGRHLIRVDTRTRAREFHLSSARRNIAQILPDGFPAPERLGRFSNFLVRERAACCTLGRTSYHSIRNLPRARCTLRDCTSSSASRSDGHTPAPYTASLQALRLAPLYSSHSLCPAPTSVARHGMSWRSQYFIAADGVGPFWNASSR